jgi:selenocysteine-specific elongation factor
LLSARRVVRFDPERGALVHAEALAHLRAAALEHVTAFQAENPLREGISREELRSRLGDIPPKLLHVVLEPLLGEGKLGADKELVRLPQKQAAPRAGDLRERALELYRKAALAPPRTPEIAGLLAVAPREATDLLALLVREGALVRVTPELLFAREAIDDLRARLVAHLEKNGQIDAQQYKDLTGQSRKFSIPLAEYFDAQKLTVRTGDVRKLRR